MSPMNKYNNATSNVTFECMVCTDQCSDSRPRKLLDGKVCNDCAATIAGQFGEALKQEFRYPPRFGQDLIAVEPFLDLLPHGFPAAYAEKKKEYETPLGSRLYCEHGKEADGSPKICGQFLGQRGQLDSQGGSITTCTGCQQKSCSMCAAQVSTKSGDHICARDQPLEDPFAELTRGKHYQICPNPACGLKVELWDGCNSLCCARCEQFFCRICGREAPHNSDHWTREGGCPRWNHPDDGNAEFDEDDDEFILERFRPRPAWALNDPGDGIVATVDIRWAKEAVDAFRAVGVILQEVTRRHIRAQTPVPEWVAPSQHAIWRMRSIAEILSTLDQDLTADQRETQHGQLQGLLDYDAFVLGEMDHSELISEQPHLVVPAMRFAERFGEAVDLLIDGFMM